jgi:hypothetical protein
MLPACYAYASLPWHCLNFLPLPQGHGSLQPTFTDLAGEKAPAKLRKQILDPHIKGPFETGWGATDYTPEEAKIILLNLPANP